MTEEQETYEAEELTLEAMTPEAPASATVRVSIEGFEWMFTLRAFGSETKAPATLLKRIKWVNEQLAKAGAKPIFGKNAAPPVAKAPEPQPEEDETPPDWCPIHKCKMKKWSKDGRSWYSHAVDLPDGETEWCTGKEK